MASPFYLRRASLFAGFLFLFFMAGTGPVAAATELGSGAEMLGGPELTPSSTLEFRFAESMVPSDNLGPSSQPPVVFSPELVGTFTWLSTRSGVFVPTGPLPLGTSWKLQLRPGLNSVSGKKIPSSSPVELFTPAFALTASRSGAWNEKDIASNIQPALAFNAAVDLESAKKSLRFEDASGRTIPSEVRFATSSDYFPLTPEQGDWADRWNQTLDPSGSPSETEAGVAAERPNLLFVTPAQPLPPGEGWKLLGSSGIRSADQKYSIPRPIDLELGTVQPLLLLGVDADNFLNSGTVANIRFNLPLAPDITADTAPEFFQVQPEPQNLTYQVDWQGMMIRGDFALGTEYQLQVAEGVIGNDGRPFAGNREVSFRFNAVAPRVYLPEITGQQLQFGRREFPVRSINLSGMNLRAIQVSPQNVPAALKSFSKYQKTEWDETNQEEVYQPLETGAITGKSIFDGPVKTPPANVDEALEFPIRWNELLGEEASGAVFLTLEGAPIPGISGKQAGAQAFVQITDLGLLWKKDRTGLHVMVFSMKTGQPIAGCEVAILDENLSPLNSGSTPETGRVRLAFEGSPAWLSVQNDGDSHVIPMGDAASELPVWSFRIPAIYPPWEDDVQKEGLLRGILFTDRPLYQAGETVSVKGILRMLSQNDISFPGELTGQLILFGPRGEKVETRVITAGPNGNFDTSSGNFDTTFTAPSLQRGEYRLGFHQGTEPFEWWQTPILTTFLVADYQPDAFEITLDTPGSVSAGQPAPALKVRGNYFFGGPLSDAKLQWTLQSSRQDFSPPGFPEFTFLPNPSEGPVAAKTTSGEMDLAPGETAQISPEWGEIHSAPMREILTVEITDLNQQTVVQQRTFDIGDHDSRGIAFKGFEVVAVAALADAHDRVHVVQLACTDRIFDEAPLVGDMFIANPHRGKTHHSAEFHDARISQIQLEACGNLPLTDFS